MADPSTTRRGFLKAATAAVPAAALGLDVHHARPGKIDLSQDSELICTHYLGSPDQLVVNAAYPC